MKDWIIGLLFVITLIVLVIFSYIYNWYKLKKEINEIINKNLLKLGKNNYQFSNKNYELIFFWKLIIILDHRCKPYYKFKKSYKNGKHDNEIFKIINNYYLKNEGEINNEKLNKNKFK